MTPPISDRFPYDAPQRHPHHSRGTAEVRLGAVEGRENTIGLKKDNQHVSLEPGGQVELSGAPLRTLHETCREVNAHLDQCKEIAEELGIIFLGLGLRPRDRREDVPWMPKGRYRIMRNYMPRVGTFGIDMMIRTCTIQANLDFGSESDMVRKFRVAQALQSVTTALFANSPFTEGKPNGYLSMRGHIWTDTDNDRSGLLEFVTEDGFGFERYVDYALDVPMYFVMRDRQYIDASGQSFRDFLSGSCLPYRERFPTISDWEGSSDHPVSRCQDQALHGSARCRRRELAAHLRAASPVDRTLL